MNLRLDHLLSKDLSGRAFMPLDIQNYLKKGSFTTPCRLGISSRFLVFGAEKLLITFCIEGV